MDGLSAAQGANLGRGYSVEQRGNYTKAMASCIGQYHTNEPDPDNLGKKLTPYLAIGVDGVLAMVDNPQAVDKAQAQWLIPSTLLTRNFKEQEQHGSYLSPVKSAGGLYAHGLWTFEGKQFMICLPLRKVKKIGIKKPRISRG